MIAGSVLCPSCRTPIPAEAAADEKFYPCARCETQLEVHAFPALNRQPVVTPVAQVLLEGEASCFNHPQKKAVIACQSCGRFLCALCDVEIGGVHRCPACLEAGRRSQRADILETRVIRYDRIALALTTVTILMWPIMIVSAPAALFLVIKYWNKRSTVLPAPRLGYVIAGILALAEIAGFITLAVFIFSHRPHA